MRPLRTLAPACLVAALLLPALGLGADRVVMFESFTNTSCPYCPDSNADLADLVALYGTTEPIQAINVQYHVWWPSSADPFYVANIADNTAATNYYAVNAVPDLRVDGSSTSQDLVEAMNDRLAVPSPLTIDVTHSIDENCQFNVQATITAVAEVPASGLIVRVALVEGHTHYDVAPGSNGQTDFYCTMRKMLPDFTGTPLTIANGQTKVLDFSSAINPIWQDIYAVVWVQDANSKEILQTGRSWATDPTYWTDYRLSYATSQPAALVEVGHIVSLTSTLTNTGTYADTYDLHLDTAGLPLGWIASVCVGTSCYPEFIRDFMVTLNPGQSQTVTIDITPTTLGEGTATMSATGRGNPCVSASALTFRAITPTGSILLVDVDAGKTYENFYFTSLDNLGKAYTYWDLLAWGRLTGSQLLAFDTVIWYTSNVYGSGIVSDVDRAALATFLDGGGNLFINGQLIGYSVYTYGGTAGEAWFQTYLGADYLRYDTSVSSVNGVAGDPITDGLTVGITGGDGANNQSYASKIAPVNGGVGCFYYVENPLPCGATHLESGASKTVYLAFSWEAISTQADRDLVLGEVLNWFGGGAVPVLDDQPSKPYLVSMPQAVPNPFNPTTAIKFEIGGREPANLQVKVFDARGRLVRTLFSGTAEPGAREIVWDGRTDRGAAATSGVYLAEVQVDTQKECFKLTLTK